MCIDETKLDELFPDAQFNIKATSIPHLEKIAGHYITTTKNIFMKLNKALRNTARKYKNILIMGDLNINFYNLKKGEYT